MTWTLDIRNIAGILEAEVSIEPGVNAVKASNWQGKSSFVQAIKTALGVARPLTEGKASGRVQLETPARSVALTLDRNGHTVQRTGQPYLTDEYDVARAELFACLDEHNQVRQAVHDGGTIEEVLLQPLDVQNIDEQIRARKRDREQVESELATATEAKRRVPAVQESVTQLESELEELEARRSELAAEKETTDVASATQSDLTAARSERDQAATQIERLERSIERTESRLEDRHTELDDLDVDTETSYEADLATARKELESIKRDKEVLQSVYSATEMVLNENRLDLLGEVTRELTGDTVVCWTCGNEASRTDLEAQLDTLGEQVSQLRAQAEARRDTVETLETRRENVRQARKREADLESEIATLEERLADHERSLEQARRRREDAVARIDTLSADVDEAVDELTDVESEIKYREAELSDTRDELDVLESRAARVDTLETEVETLTEEIEALRARKTRIEREARTAFDDAMQDVLERFETGFESARLTSNFEIVVARDGREASLDALSEGERELLGFVAALAGYESFDVAETVPVLLVDGVGGLADENLHTLVEYLQARAEYLVVTVYPEYTPFDGTEIDPSDWDVVLRDASVAD